MFDSRGSRSFHGAHPADPVLLFQELLDGSSVDLCVLAVVNDVAAADTGHGLFAVVAEKALDPEGVFPSVHASVAAVVVGQEETEPGVVRVMVEALALPEQGPEHYVSGHIGVEVGVLAAIVVRAPDAEQPWEPRVVVVPWSVPVAKGDSQGPELSRNCSKVFVRTSLRDVAVPEGYAGDTSDDLLDIAARVAPAVVAHAAAE